MQNNPHAEPLASEKIENPEERKTFFVDLLENRRGRVLRVKERGGKVSMIMVPAVNMRALAEAIGLIADWNERNP